MFRPLSETKFINDANLVSYWKLDETSGTTAVDSKGSNNGTWTNFAYSAGKYSNAGSFNGSSSYIDSGANTFIASNSVITVSAWCNINTLPSNGNYYTIIDGEYDGTSEKIFMFFNNSGGIYTIRFGTFNNSGGEKSAIYTFPSSPTTGIWYYLNGTFDGLYWNMYINGVKVATTATTQGPYSSNGNIRIGASRISGVINRYMNGQIDDVAIFSRALSSTEVLELYEGVNYGELVATPNTKLLLHLNGNSTDASGNGNNGTDTNISYVNGVFGQCASFNGTTSQISTGAWGISGGTARTISVWVYPTAVTPIKTVLGCNPNSSLNFQNNIIHIGGANSGDVYYGFSGYDYNTAGGVITANTWNHIVCVYDGGTLSPSTVHIYVNGLAKSVNGTTAPGTANTTDSNNRIGTDTLASNRFFSGQIDEVIIQDRAWSATEVLNYYNQSKGVYAPKLI